MYKDELSKTITVDFIDVVTYENLLHILKEIEDVGGKEMNGISGTVHEPNLYYYCADGIEDLEGFAKKLAEKDYLVNIIVEYGSQYNELSVTIRSYEKKTRWNY